MADAGIAAYANQWRWAWLLALIASAKNFCFAKEALGNELSRRASSLDLSLINILIADRA
jgi:hypothetical protein